MKVGTIETNVEKEKKRRLRSSLSGGSGSNGGNRNRGGGGGGSGGNDGGDKNPNNDFYEGAEPYTSNKFRVGMWFLLIVVVMTFSALIGTYIVISTNGVLEWKPFDLPLQIWISTVLILASSITYTIADGAMQNDNQPKARKWFVITTVLGATFVSSQILSWLELVQRGIYVESNPYAGFYYILTAVHAVHVLGGILALSYIVLRTWNNAAAEKESEHRKQVSNAVGWYWHTVDGLWIVLFLLLGFWK